MASRYWIKLYHEILDDAKMGRLSDVLFRRTIECFLISGDFDKEGVLPPLPDIAWRLRVPEEILTGQLDSLLQLGILSCETSGSWSVTNFKERQSAETSSQRMRNYRGSKQNKKYYGSTSCYENVTKRNVDIDRDEEKTNNLKSDADEDPLEQLIVCSPENELVKTFIDQTNIPFNSGGPDKWDKALFKLVEAGVEKDDLVTALDECSIKGMIIANLSSIVTPAIISMSRRKSAGAKPDPEDYRRYLDGEFGDVGNY